MRKAINLPTFNCKTFQQWIINQTPTILIRAI